MPSPVLECIFNYRPHQRLGKPVDIPHFDVLVCRKACIAAEPRAPPAERTSGRISGGGARLSAAGCTARDPRRARPGARHNPDRVRSDPAPSDAERTAPGERGERRSDRRGGPRCGSAGRGSSVPIAAAAGHADHADHRDRVRFGRKRDPVCDRPFWRRVAERLPKCSLG